MANDKDFDKDLEEEMQKAEKRMDEWFEKCAKEFNASPMGQEMAKAKTTEEMMDIYYKYHPDQYRNVM